MHDTGVIQAKMDSVPTSGLSPPPPDDHANLCFAAFNPQDEPRNLQEVMKCEDWPNWKEAMEKEMDQLRKLETFALEELPKGRKAVGCRWVYLIKRDLQGLCKDLTRSHTHASNTASYLLATVYVKDKSTLN